MSLFRFASCTYRQCSSSGASIMNIYSGLLFLHGHIAHVDLARQLAGVETAPAAPSPSGKREAACGAARTGDEARPGAPRQPDPCANA